MSAATGKDAAPAEKPANAATGAPAEAPPTELEEGLVDDEADGDACDDDDEEEEDDQEEEEDGEDAAADGEAGPSALPAGAAEQVSAR